MVHMISGLAHLVKRRQFVVMRMERLIHHSKPVSQTYAEYVYKKELRKSGKSEEAAAELEKYKQRQKRSEWW